MEKKYEINDIFKSDSSRFVLCFAEPCIKIFYVGLNYRSNKIICTQYISRAYFFKTRNDALEMVKLLYEDFCFDFNVEEY